MSWRPLLVLLAFAACAAPAVAVVLSPTTFGPAPALPGHFFDANGLSLASYELAWPVLVETFGSSLPARVTVDYEAKGTSQFDPGRNAVHIARDSIHSSSEGAVVAHETAHLGLANLTAGASTTEPFRFLDEGLATIIEKKVGGALDHYKSTTLALAAGRLANGSVKLDDLQRWSQYFGDPKVGADFNAYDVGAAFVFSSRTTSGRRCSGSSLSISAGAGRWGCRSAPASAERPRRPRSVGSPAFVASTFMFPQSSSSRRATVRRVSLPTSGKSMRRSTPTCSPPSASEQTATTASATTTLPGGMPTRWS
jgi:hypothetical protein